MDQRERSLKNSQAWAYLVDKWVRQEGMETCPARLAIERNAPEQEAGLRVLGGQAEEGLTQAMD